MTVNSATSDLMFSAIGSSVFDDWSAPGEKLEVYISTTGTNITDFTSIWSNRFDPAEVWNDYTLPLATYNGQDIYIAFRHHDSYNEFFIGLDNLVITDASSIVANPNQVPVATDDNGGNIVMNGADGTINILTNDTDADGNPSPTSGHTVDIDPIAPGVQATFTNPIDNSVWTYSPTTGVLTCNPATGFTGSTICIYNLCDSDNACDNATVSFTVQNTSGINEITNNIVVSPNPTTNVFTIHTDELVKNVRVYSLNGTEVIKTTNKEISLMNVENGMYIVEVQTEKGTFKTYVVKN
jgi:hypothetical protein